MVDISRLINFRFSAERAFWDERAASLEIQNHTPTKDHGEMGFVQMVDMNIS
jgi:cytochrome c peroxidase